MAGGVAAEGAGARVVEGFPTAGGIPGGGRIEREIDFDFADLDDDPARLALARFTTAGRIEAAINEAVGRPVALMLDSGTVALDVRATGALSPAHAIGFVENIPVEPEIPARVVVDQTGGDVVMGRDVKDIEFRGGPGQPDASKFEEEPVVVQPNPFSEGETIRRAPTRAAIEAGEGYRPGRGFPA